jgi:hypothetical protein
MALRYGQIRREAQTQSLRPSPRAEVVGLPSGRGKVRHHRLGFVARTNLLRSKGVVVLCAIIAATIAAVLLFTLFDEEAQAAQSKVEVETMTLRPLPQALRVDSSRTAATS